MAQTHRTPAPAEIGVRELKNRLSSVLARVRSGETVTVTDRRKPIARLVPAAMETNLDARLRTLVESGRLSWSGGKPEGLKNPGRVRGASVADAVIEDRR